jgi:copper resistance protein B
MNLRRSTLALIFLSSSALAQEDLRMMDKAVLYMIDVEEFEFSDLGDRNDLAWDADFWVGTDTDRLWVKTTDESADLGQDSSELQILYSRAIAPFWNLRTGIRREFEPKPSENSVVLSVLGLAPYGIEVEAELFLGEGGHTSAHLEAEHELLLTQRLKLTTEAEIDAHAQSDEVRGIGSGLSKFKFALRLRYEIRREFAPYIGLRWTRFVGGSEEFAIARGFGSDDLELIAGLRFWY